MEDYTIVEKYQHTKKNSSIAIRPYFNSSKENMGLEQYGLALHDGVWHQESLACLEMNGVKRYVTGLNEFAPEVKKLSPDKRKAKISEIRNYVNDIKTEYNVEYNDRFIQWTKKWTKKVGYDCI